MESSLIAFYAISIAIRYPRQVPRFLPFLLDQINSGQEQEILVQKNGDRLTVLDLRSLRPRKWLTSRVLDFALRDCTRVSRPYPLIISVEESTYLVKHSGFPPAAVDRIRNADVSRLVIIPVLKCGHYTLFILDRSTQCAKFYDSSVGNTPEGFPERVFQSLSISFSEQGLKQYGWHQDLAFVRVSVRQQGNGHDCGLMVISHAMLANADVDSRSDVRFSYESMNQLRKDLLHRFLEDRPWSDCESQEVRIKNPDYQVPVNEVEEVSDDDEIQIIEPDELQEPRARERKAPRGIDREPRPREHLEPRVQLQEPRARERREEPRPRDVLEPRVQHQEPRARERREEPRPRDVLEPRVQHQEPRARERREEPRPREEAEPRVQLEEPRAREELEPRGKVKKPAQHKVNWRSVQYMKKALRHFRNIKEMEAELTKMPNVMKMLLRRSYLPAGDPGKFHFGPSWYRVKIKNLVKKHEARMKCKEINKQKGKYVKSKK